MTLEPSVLGDSRPQQRDDVELASIHKSPAMAAPPAIPSIGSTESFNPDFNHAPAPIDDGALHSPVDHAAPISPEQRGPPEDAQTQQRVHDVLHSDVGVATLLNRLKASIASARVSANSVISSGSS